MINREMNKNMNEIILKTKIQVIIMGSKHKDEYFDVTKDILFNQYKISNLIKEGKFAEARAVFNDSIKLIEKKIDIQRVVLAEINEKDKKFLLN